MENQREGYERENENEIDEKDFLENFQDPRQQGSIEKWMNDADSSTPTTNDNKLYPTLYVGESAYGLFATPAFVNGHTVTVAPKYLGPPLLEGPTPIAVKNENPQRRSDPQSRPVALIDLEIAKITHRTVDGEFLLLGYHEPPELAQSQIIPRRSVRPHFPSLSFIHSEDQRVGALINTTITDKGNVDSYWAIGRLWKNQHWLMIIATTASALFVFISCWIMYYKIIITKQDRHEQNCMLEWEAKSAQTSKSLGIFWRTRPTHQLPPGWLQVGNMMYNPEDRLGHGCEGTVVFRLELGRFDDREVAVKRVIADIRLADREVDLLRESDAHPNVIRYFCMESDSNFRYIALELCDYSLSDYVENEKVREYCPLSEMDILLQATKGLAYLHGINIVHRDMKPQNVLVSRHNKHDNVRALISDFGLCKRLQAGRKSVSRRSGLTGTDGWIAPEALTSESSVTCAVDVFSLGCIYFYVLSRGKHPFGDVLKRQANIMQGEYNLESLNATNNSIAVTLIESMIQYDPKKRPSSANLVMHPFFWTKERQLQFFMDVSDRIERVEDDNVVIRRLEENSRRAVGTNWRSRICSALTADLRKYRTYRGASVRDLLRAMRNKKHHYRELPPDVQQSMGQIPEQFVTYFTDRFPQLLLHTYEALLCCANEHTFAGYYSEESKKLAAELFADEAAEAGNDNEEGSEWAEVAGSGTKTLHPQNEISPTNPEGASTEKDLKGIRKRKKHRKANRSKPRV